MPTEPAITEGQVMIDHPGMFNLPAEVYHGDPVSEPSLSSSIAKILLKQSPAHAAYAHPRLNPDCERKKSTKVMDFGDVAHELLLGIGKGFVAIDAKTRSHKAWKDQAPEVIESGKTPLLKSEFHKAERMVEAAHKQLREHDIGDVFEQDGDSEVVMVWQDPCGAWCRGMIDRLPADRSLIIDYKTGAGSAKADEWVRQAYRMGYPISGAFYQRGFAYLEKRASLQTPVLFIVQENDPPHLLSVNQISGQGEMQAHEQAEEAVQIWDRCMKSGEWPGYGNSTFVVDPPGWEMAKWEEHQTIKELNQYDGVAA